MNNDEINDIKDVGLRNIRMKYWKMRHDAFLDERGIPDQELEKIVNELDIAEAKEVAAYLAKE